MKKTMLFVMGFFMTIGFIFGAWLWPYSINTWLEFFGKEPTVTWWQGGFIGFIPIIGGTTMIPVAFITWVLMLFLA